jgi:hypothetical protein
MAIQPARASILFDNTSDGFAGNSSPVFSPSVESAQSFSSGGSAISQMTLELNLYQNGSSSGTFFVGLYDNTGSAGAPGNFIATLASGQSIASLGTSQNNLWTSSLLTVNQPAGTYDIVVGLESGSSSGLNWGYESSDLTQGTAYQSFNGAWLTVSDVNQRMQVSSVPEPAGYVAASFLVLFCIGHFINKRRNKCAA